jgi:hypothetical protein
MTENTLEQLLRKTASEIRYPQTPDFAPRIPAYERAERPRLLRGALAFSMVAVLVLTAAMAIVPARDAIARFFGVEGSRIEFVQTPPAETPVNGSGLGPSATPVAPAEIEAITGFEPALVDGDLLEAFVVTYVRDAVAVLRYEDFDLWQARLEGEATFGKGLPPEAVVEELEVNGRPATWLTGAVHLVSYTNALGIQIYESQRAVERSTLIWRTENLFYRMETDLSLAEAVAIAETLP